MKNALLIVLLSASCNLLSGQSFKFSFGPEIHQSISHPTSFFGVGGSVQMDWWVKEELGLGLHAGYVGFSGKSSASGINTTKKYSLVPLMFVVRYPIPLFRGLYGQDMFGYSIPNDVRFISDGRDSQGGFTYYFALGYLVGKHFDVSVKVGRPRLDKKNDPVDVNEHTVGLKLAYIL